MLWWLGGSPHTACTMRRLHPLRMMEDCMTRKMQQGLSSSRPSDCGHLESIGPPSLTEGNFLEIVLALTEWSKSIIFHLDCQAQSLPPHTGTSHHSEERKRIQSAGWFREDSGLRMEGPGAFLRQYKFWAVIIKWRQGSDLSVCTILMLSPFESSPIAFSTCNAQAISSISLLVAVALGMEHSYKLIRIAINMQERMLSISECLCYVRQIGTSPKLEEISVQAVKNTSMLSQYSAWNATICVFMC